MFLVGICVNYLLVFPLTVRFLGTYQVSEDVANMLTLQSYIDTLITMSLMIGLVFELPVVCAILGRLHIVSGRLMRRYRRHAIVAILTIAAIITPADPFSMMIAAAPLLLLYEASVMFCKSRPKEE